MSAPSDRLLARYGGRDEHRGRRRVLVAIGAAVFLAIIVLAGLRFADQPVRYDDVGYQHAQAGGIDLTFQVTMRPGTVARCRVEALDSSRGQVGFREVEIPAQSVMTTSRTVAIATIGSPVSAAVVSCEPV